MDIVSLQTEAVKGTDTGIIDISSDSAYVESTQEKELSDELQTEAFGEATTDFRTAKTRAASILSSEYANEILRNSAVGLRNGTETKDTQARFFRYTAPLTEHEYVESSALETMAAEQAVAESAVDDPDGVGSLPEEDLLFTAEDRAKFDLETEMINRTTKDFSEGSWWGNLWDIAEGALPFVQAFKDWRASPTGTFHVLPSEVREKQRAVFKQAKDSMTVEEYGKFLESEYKRLKEEGRDNLVIMEYFEDMFTHNSRFDDAMQIVDVIGVGKLFKGGNKVTRALTAGNKTKAMESLEESTKVEQLGHVLPSSAKPAENGVVSLSAMVEANENLKIANSKALEAVEDTFKVEREIPDVAMKKYVEIASKEINSKLPNTKKKIIDTNLYRLEKSTDGSTDMIVTLGTGTDGTQAFKTVDAADTFVKENTTFVKGEYDFVRTAEGWFVKARVKVPYTGRIMHTEDYVKEGKPWKLKGLGRFFLGRIGVPDTFHEANNVAVRSITRLRQIGAEMLSPIKDLTKADLDSFEVVKAKQLNEERWLSAAELTDLGYSEKVIKANEAYRDISDLAYVIDNIKVRKEMENVGYKIFKANPTSEGFIGKIVDDVKDFGSSTFKDLDTGKVYNIGEMSATELEELKKGGKVFVRSSAQNIDINSKTPIKYYIAQREHSRVQELPMFLIEYVPGGRRFYPRGAVYGKLARTMNINGKRTIIKPKTLFAGLDKAALTKKASEINKALDVFEKFVNKELTRQAANIELDKLAAGAKYFKASSLKELRKALGNNIDPLLRVEIVEDGQELAQVRKLKAENLASLIDDQLYFSNSMQDLLEHNARGFLRRGKALTDVDGDYVPTLSAVDTAKRTLDRLMNTYAFDEYNKMYAAEFRRLFSDVINPYDLAHLSDIDLLKFGNLIDPKEAVKNKALRNKINAARHMQYKWNAVTEQATDWDKMVQTHMTNLAQKLGEKMPNIFGRGTKAYEYISSASPDKAFMGLTFQTFLCLFNPKQLFVQALGAVNTVALEPLYGTHAVSLYAPLRMAMNTDNTKVLGKIAQGAARLLGVSPTDFQELVTAMKKIGAYAAEDVQLFKHSRSILDSNSFKKASAFFFREGERFNMIVAQTASYLKQQKILGRAPKSYDELKKVLAYGEELYLNMSRASVTPLQRGTKLPTQLIAQFTAYPIRFMEALLNKKFNSLQKASLLFTNIALFGAAGTFGRGPINYAITKGKQLMGIEEPLPGEDVFMYGYIDSALKEAGIDISASILGPGLLDKPWQIIVENEMQLPVVSGLGATYNTLVAISKALFPKTTDADLVTALSYFSSGKPTLPTLRNATKGYLAYSLGKLYTNNHQLLKEDVSTLEAALYGLGFRSRTEQVLSDSVQYIIDKETTLDSMIKDLRASYRKFIQFGNKETWEEYRILLNSCLQSVPDSWRQSLMKEITGIYKDYPKIPALEREGARAWISGDTLLHNMIQENK